MTSLGFTPPPPRICPSHCLDILPGCMSTCSGTENNAEAFSDILQFKVNVPFMLYTHRQSNWSVFWCLLFSFQKLLLKGLNRNSLNLCPFPLPSLLQRPPAPGPPSQFILGHIYYTNMQLTPEISVLPINCATKGRNAQCWHHYDCVRLKSELTGRSVRKPTGFNINAAL